MSCADQYLEFTGTSQAPNRLDLGMDSKASSTKRFLSIEGFTYRMVSEELDGQIPFTIIEQNSSEN